MEQTVKPDLLAIEDNSDVTDENSFHSESLVYLSKDIHRFENSSCDYVEWFLSR